MSVYLFTRLHESGRIPPGVLLESLAASVRRRVSFVEELLVQNAKLARGLADCFGSDGEEADPAWRPDPRLMLDLPPGICERLLSFPFRERAGAVEVATVSPLDGQVRDEFARHLGRPIALFRGSLQGLLAAAGAPVDFRILNNSLSEPPGRASSRPLPLIKKSGGKDQARGRTRTSPGVGRSALSSIPPDIPGPSELPGPPSAHERMLNATDAQQLALSLGLLIAGPSVIFEIAGDFLLLRAMSPHDDCDESPIDLDEPCALTQAAASSKYVGPWYPSAIHERFSHVFTRGELVRVDRVGSAQSGLVVARRVTVDGTDDSELLLRARRVWGQLAGRNTLYG